MLLKSLELQGFKTFPDKTTLAFDNGITAVVGPNGSGKSNISDAVRWVLGEQSTRVLRCSKMEDVIFNGTPERKAQGYAEVTLTIDNSGRQLAFESDTVAVTRRFYRSGDSEYLINKVVVRLKDIHELFMDTGLGRDGYSIIGQGKIDSIVAARSEDRREIFEEAAGISRFRYRKEESERRLVQAEENLLRLRDILSELESRVGPLKEQSEKAEKYLEYAGEKRTLEIGLWLNTLNRSGQVIREHDDKILLVKEQYDEAEKRIDEIGRQMEENFQQTNALTVKAEEIRSSASAKDEEAVRKDGEISVLENDILHNSRNMERLQKEIQEAGLSEQELDQEIAQKKAEIREKEAEASQKEREFQERAGDLSVLQQGMTDSAGKLEGYTKNLAQLSSETSEWRVSSMSAASSLAELGLRLENIQKALEESDRRGQELQKESEDFSGMLRESEEKINSLQNTVRGYEMRLESRKKRLETAKSESDRLNLDAREQERRARLLEDLERNLEGFTQSVKLVMKESAHEMLKGIRGPVSRLFRVPAEYATAIEIALGAAMQNIVVETEQDAKRAIGFLKQRDGGRATFLPLTTIKGRELQENNLDECPGFVGIASGLCTCESDYAGILSSLLGRIAVAEDLDSAVAIARRYGYRFRIVTLDGQVVNTGGSLTGGSLAKNSGLLSRAGEIERIRQEAAKLAAKAASAEQTLKAAAEEVSAAEASLSASRGELSTQKEDYFRLKTESEKNQTERKGIEENAGKLRQEYSSEKERQGSLEKSKDEAEKKLVLLAGQMKELQDRIGEISGGREELSKKCEDLSAHLQELRLAMLSAQKDCESLRLYVEGLSRRKLDHAGKTEALQNEIRETQRKTDLLNSQIASLKEEAKLLRGNALEERKSVDKVNEQRMALEKLSSELRAGEREKSAEKENIGHEMARLEERKANLQKEYDAIVGRLWEEYELTRREAEGIGAEIEDVPKAQKRLNELKSKIKALGNVNVAAVEEYKEVSERYRFMKTQVEDVEKSRDELKKLIGELTHQMKDLFVERFGQISRHFLQTFQELFGGGTAELKLSNPEDILNSGIDISVQPPGKIVTHLELLSGGEKALVAIALYFAIMKVSPPPFCVLDEIEAALDDVNVTRFASYLRRMNKNTQFIVITHRRGTMEEADVLYGVTMQDEGISKLLELRASELEQKLGMK